MSTQEILDIVVEWFSRARAASLELPKGWFGRPMDNLHQLTWSAALQHKVLLELDHQVLLIMTEPQRADASDTELRIDGSASVALDWQEYGNMVAHVDDQGRGTVRFVCLVPHG